jgi:RNA polymerase sigma factor (sigma-70 family)
MASRQLSKVLQQLRHLIGVDGAQATDAQLLQRFVGEQDESAFRALLERHGPMVLGVCRRTLANPHDAEDAFQATFLLLVRKAGSLRDRDLVGNWLYGVACRIARRARQQAVRRALPAAEVPDMAIAEAPPEALGTELRPLLDEELQRLPRKYRAPVVLCYLEGQTNEAAAHQLRCPTGTVKTRLARARDLLRDRLAQRGLALSTAALAAALAPDSVTAAVPTSLAETTLKSALLSAAGQTNGVSASVAGLLEGAAREMAATKLQTIAAVLLALTCFGAGAGLLAYHHRGNDELATPVADTSNPADGPPLDDGGLAASVSRRVNDWQPTHRERRFDEIGWAKDLRHARHLARDHNRPIFLVMGGGHIETGRCNASTSNMRASALSHDRVIALLNQCYVPVYVTAKDYSATGPAPAEEKAELERIRLAGAENGIVEKGRRPWILDPNGRPLYVNEACTSAMADQLLAVLQFHATDLRVPAGKPLVTPAVQSRVPPHASDALVLHLTARYVERRGDDLVPLTVQFGQSTNYFSRGIPAENWLVFDRTQQAKLLPSSSVKADTTWTIDPETAALLFVHCYPPTECNVVEENRIEQASLIATVVSMRDGVARARLDGSLRMKHRFAPEKDDKRFVDAAFTGFLDFDIGRPVIRTLQLVTTRGTYAKSDFGIAVRSVP